MDGYDEARRGQREIVDELEMLADCPACGGALSMSIFMGSASDISKLSCALCGWSQEEADHLDRQEGDDE
jgi:transcription elongation factor Elf1